MKKRGGGGTLQTNIKQENLQKNWYKKPLPMADWARKYAEYRATKKIEPYWVLYESHAGAGMVCNPYALFKAFQARPDFKNYRHIWVLRDYDEMVRLSHEYEDDDNVYFVMYRSTGYASFTARAKYLINNTTFPPAFSKREGQLYLNTWHSITVKSLGFDTPDGNRIIGNMLRNFLMSDYIVSPNEFTTEIYNNSFRLRDIYRGKYIEHGFPRNDLVINTDREEILEKLARTGVQVDGNKKIILYAPTWFGAQSQKPVIDMEKYDRLFAYLTQHIDMEKYELLMKPHHVVYRNLSQEEKDSNRYISYVIDANELLAAADILITDYSSIYFDYLIKDKPILFYMPDYEEYQKTRGIYFKLEELPGPSVFDLPDLADCINNIDQVDEQTAEKRRKTKDWACKYDDGAASARILNLFMDENTSDCRLLEAEKTGKKTILFYMGRMAVNGATAAGLALLNAIDYDRYDVSVFVLGLKGIDENRNFDRIPKEVRVILRTGGPHFAPGEKSVYDHTLVRGMVVYDNEKELQRYLMEREYTRSFGSAIWDYYIDFYGYGPLFSCLTMLGAENANAKRFIWQHSDVFEDFSNDEKRELNNTKIALEALRAIYDRADKVVAATKAVCEINKRNFATAATAHKFTYCTNLLDGERIEKCLQERPLFQMENWLAFVKDGEEEQMIKNMHMVPIPKQSAKFVTMGRLMPEKNHVNLIKAMKMLIDEGVDAVLYIVGDGHMRQELSDLITELGISDRILLTGVLHNPFMLLKRCDCFVFPSIYEAQGLVVLEARVVGLPIIVSNYGAVESVLLDDQQFLLKGTDEFAIYEGLKAYINGKVPSGYAFSVAEYNEMGKKEFARLLDDSGA